MLNTPNILSIFRLCLVPVFVMVYFSGIPNAGIFAVGVYVIAVITDFLDGHIARKYDMITNLGKVLDPLSDKMFTFAVLCCLMIDFKISFWFVGIFFIKECLMGIGGIFIHRYVKIEIPPSNIVGKAATVIFFLCCCAIIVFESLSPEMADIMICVALVISCASLVTYFVTFVKIVKNRSH
jgi:Phosphatidylglycerophosphate synthase